MRGWFTAVFEVILMLVFSACAEEAYYVVTNKANVNMRAAPETKSHLVMLIKTRGTKLTVLSSVTDNKGTEWLQVESQLGKKGYIQAAFLTRTAGKPVIKNSGGYPLYTLVLSGRLSYNTFCSAPSPEHKPVSVIGQQPAACGSLRCLQTSERFTLVRILLHFIDCF